MSGGWVRVERNIYKRGPVHVTRWRDATGKRQQATYDTLTEARAVRSEMETRNYSGRSTDVSRRREDLSGWWEPYMLSTTTNAKSSRDRDASLWRNHVQPAFGHVQVGSITPSSIEGFQAGKLAAGRWEASTIRSMVTLLSGMLGLAVRDQVLDTNPVSLVKKPQLPEREAQFLELAEVGALERAMLVWWRSVVTMLFATGVRIGELRSIRVRDVNLLEGWVRVRTSGAKDEDIRGLTKSEAGVRVVPTLPRSLCETLAKQIADRGLGPDDYLFTGTKGGRLDVNNFRNRVWDPAVERAGLGDVTPHSLRHTAISTWLGQGIEPFRVARWAGHETTDLQRVYGHLLHDPRAEQHRDELEAILTAARVVRPPVRGLG